MRILFYDPSLTWSGRARAFFAAGRALSARGYEVTCACPQNSTFAEKAREIGLRTFAVDAGPLVWTRSGALRRALQEHFVDVVFVHDEGDDLAASYAVSMTGRGAVVRRIAAGEAPVLSRRTRWARRFAPVTYLLTGTNPVDVRLPPGATVVQGELGVDPPPAELDEPIVIAWHSGAPRLACLAAGDAYRRVYEVLRAVALLAERYPAVRLTIAGSGGRSDELRLHAAALNLARRVEFFPDGAEEGALRTAELAWVVGDGDDAAFGCLTAMARAIPVLAQYGPVTGRFIASGRHGDLFPTLEPHLMAATVAVYAAQPARRAAVGRQARERVERDFPERAMTNSFEEATRAAREYVHDVRSRVARPRPAPPADENAERAPTPTADAEELP